MMGKLFDFTALLNRYTAQCGPVWVLHEGQKTALRAAMLPAAESAEEGMGGMRVAKSREMVCPVRLADALEGAGKAALAQLRVVYEGQVYTPQEERDYRDFADVCLYKLSWLGPLSGEEEDGV